jgi:hypothetical protein
MTFRTSKRPHNAGEHTPWNTHGPCTCKRCPHGVAVGSRCEHCKGRRVHACNCPRSISLARRKWQRAERKRKRIERAQPILDEGKA